MGCVGDRKCLSTQKCCSNGCGKTCVGKQLAVPDSLSHVILLLAQRILTHLSYKLNWAFLIACCLLSVRPSFRLYVHFSHSPNLAQTILGWKGFMFVQMKGDVQGKRGMSNKRCFIDIVDIVIGNCIDFMLSLFFSVDQYRINIVSTLCASNLVYIVHIVIIAMLYDIE